MGEQVVVVNTGTAQWHRWRGGGGGHWMGGGIDGGEGVVDTGWGGGRHGGSDRAGGSHGKDVPVWTREVAVMPMTGAQCEKWGHIGDDDGGHRG